MPPRAGFKLLSTLRSLRAHALRFTLTSMGIVWGAFLLTYGFARDLVDRMDIAPIRDIVADSLLESLPDNEELRSMLS